MVLVETHESARFRFKLINAIKAHSVTDMPIVRCDGLKGVLDAIEAVFRKAVVQLCILHMIRNSLRDTASK